MHKREAFYAKLLLFGEYSILLGSSALSIPYGHFNAELSFIREDKYTDVNFAIRSNQLLKEFREYLIKEWSQANSILNLKQLSADLNDGLYLESTIPQSYGLGSSGAVCAALYARYALNRIQVSGKITSHEIIILREIFSKMESFFHGQSSGIDPLGIYLRYPLHFNCDSVPSLVGIPRTWKNQASGIFLIDSGQPGKTGPLVNSFIEKFAPAQEISAIGQRFCNLTNACIRTLLSGDNQGFWNHLANLSEFQLNSMQPMIPASLRQYVQSGFENGLFFLKLCGSGGGGFLTGFAPDFPSASAWFNNQNINIIPVYLARTE